MHISEWPIGNVRPYPNNPRVLRNAAQKVAESIQAFGWRQPIVVDADGVIVIGHARHAAAKLLKLETVPVHVADNLSDDQIRALRIADNKTSEFADWDDAKLTDELSALMSSFGDIAMTGFSASEFDALEMQAKAALAELAPIVLPEPTVPPAVDHADYPLDDPTDQPDDEADADTEEQPDTRTVEDIVNMVPFNVMLPEDTRQELYDAIAKAKTSFGITTTHDAILLIARNYNHA